MIDWKITTPLSEIGMCPNQLYGSYDGKPIYCRARHGYWTIFIAESWETPVDSETVLAEGESKNAGWWYPQDAYGYFASQLKHLAKRSEEA